MGFKGILGTGLMKLNEGKIIMSLFTRQIQSLIQKYLNFEFRRVHPKFSTKFMRDRGKKGLVVAEIGVLEGTNAKSMLENVNIKKLYLIDPYIEYEGFKYFNQMLSLIYPPIEKAEKKAIRRLKNYSDKIEWIKEKSHDCLNKIPMLDWVYIDGNHEAWCFQQDMDDYWLKMKSGGVFSGHDVSQKQITWILCQFVVKHKEEIKDFSIDFQDWVIVKR